MDSSHSPLRLQKGQHLSLTTILMEFNSAEQDSQETVLEEKKTPSQELFSSKEYDSDDEDFWSRPKRHRLSDEDSSPQVEEKEIPKIPDDKTQDEGRSDDDSGGGPQERSDRYKLLQSTIAQLSRPDGSHVKSLILDNEKGTIMLSNSHPSEVFPEELDDMKSTVAVAVERSGRSEDIGDKDGGKIQDVQERLSAADSVPEEGPIDSRLSKYKQLNLMIHL